MENSKLKSFEPLYSEAKSQSASSKTFDSDYLVSQAFYQKALQCYHKRELLIATFMMQQAVKFTCTSIIKAFTGLKIKTDCIKEIIHWSKCCVLEIRNIFPANSVDEYFLLQRLENADINPYPIAEMEITEEEVLLLLQKIEKLQQLALVIFVDKIGMKPKE
jgi:hypothetical protein